WRAYVAQLAAHDAFYAGVAFEAGPLDRFVLSRLLKSAWAIRRQRMVGDPVRAGLARPDTSEEVALVLELSKRFAEAARASGARPLVVLIDTPGTPAAASPFIAERLAAAGVDAIRTASSCAGDDPANFAGDGHLSAPCAERVAGRVRDWIAGD